MKIDINYILLYNKKEIGCRSTAATNFCYTEARLFKRILSESIAINSEFVGFPR